MTVFKYLRLWPKFRSVIFSAGENFKNNAQKQNSHFTAKRIKMDRKILGSMPGIRLNSIDLDTPTETGFNPRASSTSSKPRKFFPSAADNLDNIFKKTLDISTQLQRYPSVIPIIFLINFSFLKSFLPFLRMKVIKEATDLHWDSYQKSV